MHDDHKSSLFTGVECTVYDNPDEADKWVKIKHAGQLDGAGTVPWTAQQVHRFEEKVEGKSSVSLQALRLLEKSKDVPAVVKSNLKNLPLSSLERLISDPKVRSFLGIEINGGVIQSEIEQKEVIKGLTHIAKDLLNPEFNVKLIYTKDDRHSYISKIPKSGQPNKKNKAAKPWQSNPKATSTTPASPKPKPNPKDRDRLIPKTCLLKINNPKVNNLYYELQKLPLSKFQNVAAVSFRVFVEHSMDCYVEGNKLTRTKDGRSALNKDTSLRSKIIEVANHLEDNRLAEKSICKGIKSAVNNPDGLLGVETLHAYVHNDKFSAIASTMIPTWDNIQPFLEKVWENIK